MCTLRTGQWKRIRDFVGAGRLPSQGHAIWHDSQQRTSGPSLTIPAHRIRDQPQRLSPWGLGRAVSERWPVFLSPPGKLGPCLRGGPCSAAVSEKGLFMALARCPVVLLLILHFWKLYIM